MSGITSNIFSRTFSPNFLEHFNHAEGIKCRIMRRAIIVTRPLEQARAFCQQLYQLGMDPLPIPALSIEPTPWSPHTRKTLEQLTHYDFVHFSSPNAVLYSLGRLPVERRIFAKHSYLGVMGEGSRAALGQYIHHETHRVLSPPPSGAQDSEALLQLLQKKNLASAFRRALFVKGVGGRRFLSDWLEQQGVDTSFVEVYQRVPVTMTEDIKQYLQRSLNYDRVDVVLTSSEGAQAIAALCRSEQGIGAHLFTKTVFTTHERVADMARSVGFQRVHLCAPGDAALLAALESAPP